MDEADELYRAAFFVLSLNLVHGDAMTMRDMDGAPISVVEWGYLGKGKFQRRDFRLDVLTGMASLGAEDSLFSQLGRHEIFTPIKVLSADDTARFGRICSRRNGGCCMNEQAGFTLRGRNPDVLTCIANLSNDEVFTPPAFANRILDSLAEAWAARNGDANIWADSSVTFLDPCTKSGVFLREITTRLIAGLAEEIPDLQERVDHILTRQIFGIGITTLTSLLARRSLYCSKHANGEHSVARGFASDGGNIWFERTEHSWQNGRCTYCNASQNALDRGNSFESHAYAFIHADKISDLISELFGGDMRFDVIIGNPPYQLGSDGGTRDVPIYQRFVEQAKALEPRFLAMVIPSRWMASGLGLNEFREGNVIRFPHPRTG